MTVTPPRTPERKRRTGQLSGLQIMFAAILAIGLILGLNFTSLVSAGRPLQQLYDQVTDEITRLEAEQTQLLQERDYARGDAYVEDWARDEGKMIKPGEVLVVPVPSGSTVETTPEPAPSIALETKPPEPENWQLWWALFFDSSPPSF